MDILLVILGAICVIIGLLGSVIPILPGSPISYVGLLLLLLVDGCTYTPTFMLIMLAVVVIKQVLDYYIPIWGIKKYGGSKYGQWGGVLGLLLGLFFMPWGLILGPFVGAVVAEMLAGKTHEESIKAGFGSFVGTLLTVVLSMVLTSIMAYSFFAEVCRIYFG